jgi:hypothetical protein
VHCSGELSRELWTCVRAGEVAQIEETVHNISEAFGARAQEILSSSNFDGNTLLHIVVGEDSFAKTSVDQCALAALIIKAGAIVNKLNVLGESPLLLASRSSHTLSKEGEDLGRLTLVRELLLQRADPNAGDMEGETALMEAACIGDACLCKLLLDAKAAADQRSFLGSSARDFAFEHMDILALLERQTGRRPNNTSKQLRMHVAKLFSALSEEDDGLSADRILLDIVSLAGQDATPNELGQIFQTYGDAGELLLELCQKPSPRGMTATAVSWLLSAG